MSMAHAIQDALYARLTGYSPLTDLLANNVETLGPAIYDHVPQVPNPADNAPFPYITIGDDTLIPWDTDDANGGDATTTIHIWSRREGRSEVKLVMGAVYDSLHAKPMMLDGYHAVLVSFEYEEVLLDIDGQTRHGLQRYRILMHE